MKKITSLLAACLFTLSLFAQDANLPSATVKTLEGENINIQDAVQKDKITVISFWATWCSPCKRELDAILDYYEEWQEEYGVELIALSVDETRSISKIKPMIEDKGWPYRVLVDPTKEFQTVANVTSVPYTMVIDGTGKVVYTHTGYNTGDEEELGEVLKELAEKKGE